MTKEPCDLIQRLQRVQLRGNTAPEDLGLLDEAIGALQRLQPILTEVQRLRSLVNDLIEDSEAEIESLRKQIAGYEANERSVNEALNRGDGAYRP